MKQRGEVCEICARLGKRECGYHQFKNQYLSRFSSSCLQENQFAQTQSSLHRRQQQQQRSQYVVSVTPPKNSSRVSFNYQQTHSPLRNIAINSTTPARPATRVLFTPPKTQQHRLPVQQQTNPAPNYIMRSEGGQVLYYPIYPVYEVIYEPVSLPSSVTHSRMAY